MCTYHGLLDLVVDCNCARTRCTVTKQMTNVPVNFTGFHVKKHNQAISGIVRIEIPARKKGNNYHLAAQKCQYNKKTRQINRREIDNDSEMCRFPIFPSDFGFLVLLLFASRTQSAITLWNVNMLNAGVALAFVRVPVAEMWRKCLYKCGRNKNEFVVSFYCRFICAYRIH